LFGRKSAWVVVLSGVFLGGAVAAQEAAKQGAQDAQGVRESLNDLCGLVFSGYRNVSKYLTDNWKMQLFFPDTCETMSGVVSYIAYRGILTARNLI
jgi:hypothetical protein